jgi:hypothetical protein
MVRRHPLLRGDVAEHRLLEAVVASHRSPPLEWIPQVVEQITGRRGISGSSGLSG